MDINELCINCFKPTGGEEVCMNCGHVQTDTPRQLCHLYPHTVLNNRYVIGSDINNGGFGVVYRAYDLKLETVVAIKELLPTQNSIVNRVPGTTDVIPVGEKRAEQFEILKQKFLEEARLMAQFSQYDGIVHIYDFFECNNTVYHVMEYLEGENLREYLNHNSNQMDYDQAISIMLPIMEILKVAHKHKVIHCDVSPDNIFICNNGKVKLIDFGAAKFSDTVINEEEAIVAKPGYTPPEQYRRKGEIGPYTDIYAVGAVLYRLLSGVIPEESIDRVEKDELEKLSKIGISVPIHAEKSIMKALALRENARFKSMDDFIKAILGEKKADFPEEELKKKKIIRAVSVTAAFAVMIASVFITYFIKSYNALIPAKSEQITMWYIDNGDEALNARWDNVEKHFSEFALTQDKENLSDTKVEIIGVPAAEYDEKLQKAFDDGNAPDVYESSSSQFDEYAYSLDDLYEELNDVGFEDPYAVMKSLYATEDKIAFCFDTPVLYTYTDFNYIEEKPAQTTALNDLINAKAKGGDFKYSLLCNPEALVYSSYCYGYELGGDTEVVEKLYNASRVFDKNGYVSPDSIFVSTKKNAQYYIGMMSEFSNISKNSRAGQESFDVSTLTGSDMLDYFVFPEVFSISEQSSNSEKQTAVLLLYYLIANVDGQSDICKRDNNTYYLPMFSDAVSNIGYYDKYQCVYESEYDDVVMMLSKYNSVKEAAEEAATITKDEKSTFDKLEKALAK